MLNSLSTHYHSRIWIPPYYEHTAVVPTVSTLEGFHFTLTITRLGLVSLGPFSCWKDSLLKILVWHQTNIFSTRPGNVNEMLGKLIVWLTFCLERLLLRNSGCGIQWLITTCKTRAVFANSQNIGPLGNYANCTHYQAIGNHRKQAPYEYRPHPKHQERSLVTLSKFLYIAGYHWTT